MMPQPDYIAWVLGITSEVILTEQREEDSSKNHRCAAAIAIMIGSATEVSGIGDWNALLVLQTSWQRNIDVLQGGEEDEFIQLS